MICEYILSKETKANFIHDRKLSKHYNRYTLDSCGSWDVSRVLILRVQATSECPEN